MEKVKEDGETMNYKKWKKLKRKETLLKEAARVINVQEEHLTKTIKRFLKEIEEMKRILNSKREKLSVSL
ncbi:MAG TPA: hypothetical protein ENG45_01570 [Candidatus Aenigmarchaeota archaeon]|nr:hypothetical protein [Candidatus Aenigmarchaeota archaeon]